jgi:hypothetical protein
MIENASCGVSKIHIYFSVIVSRVDHEELNVLGGVHSTFCLMLVWHFENTNWNLGYCVVVVVVVVVVVAAAAVVVVVVVNFVI